MRVALLCSTIVAHKHGGIPAVNRQMLRQLERHSIAHGVPLHLDVWSLHDGHLTPAQLAREIGLETSVEWHGFESSKVDLALAATRPSPSPELILTTHIGLSPIARLLAGRFTRTFQFLHGIECWRRLPLRTRWGLEPVETFLCNSAFTHLRFLECNPEYSSVPHRVCWLGVPSEHRSLASPRKKQDEATLSVLIVGRILGEERYKGHEQLLAVWPEVLASCPNARLDIVGDGSAANTLRTVAKDLIARGAVKFWGQLPDEELRERYEECSVFAMPSKGEGFGLVYLEAMSHRKPCIASIDDAAHEVVLDGETGILVPYSDRSALKNALTRLLADSSLRERLGAAGERRLTDHFSEARFGERLWMHLQLPIGDNVK